VTSNAEANAKQRPSPKTWVMRGVVLLVALGCAPSIDIALSQGDAASKPPNCELDIYEPGLLPADHVLPVVGEVDIHDSGFTVDCGKARIRQLLRERACEAGADAIEIVQEKNPDLISSCYRVKARLIRYADESEAGQP